MMHYFTKDSYTIVDIYIINSVEIRAEKRGRVYYYVHTLY